ncbi:hypothetical protein KW784_01935, partial [Candidatus Parcubacteria bacterium]|nr:hypothetical protein [Candidatus Parcubacteria bacterium]
MRNRNLIIGIAILLFAGLILWLLFFRSSATPLIAGLILWLLFFRSSATPLIPIGGIATSSPFGLGEASGVPAVQPDFEGEVAPLPEASGGGETEERRLFKLNASPVAGFVVLSRASTTAVRLAERATGHVFDVKLPEIEKVRLTNNTLPQIYEAYFRQDGSAALFRGLDESDTIKNMALAFSAPRASSTDGLYGVSMALLRGEIDAV